MDWDLAIERNREALLRILAALFALVGLPEDEAPTSPLTLPRRLHAYALRILRAAESAIRRLVVVAARDVAVQARPGGEGWRRDFGGKHEDGAAAIRIPAFPLLDPPRTFPFDPPGRRSASFPRICVVGVSEPAPVPGTPVLSPDDPVGAAGLCRRLLASRRALTNLPAQARRLARWRARRRLRPGRVAPLRIGRPPGRRKRPVHAVDEVLKECHWLARHALSPPDTS